MKAWEENIRKVVPYVPGEQPQVKDIIKLNTNENPYPPSPGVKKAHEEMEVSRFALYPDPAAVTGGKKGSRRNGSFTVCPISGSGSKRISDST